MLLITLSVWITLRVIHALHIDVIPADSIQFDGNTVSTHENYKNNHLKFVALYPNIHCSPGQRQLRHGLSPAISPPSENIKNAA